MSGEVFGQDLLQLGSFECEGVEGPRRDSAIYHDDP
jgi:hypothetical protein